MEFAAGANTNYGAGHISDNAQTQFNFVDTFSWQRGSHTLKFGGDYRRLSSHYIPTNYFISEFLSVPDAVADSVALMLTAQNRSATVYFYNVSSYAQDTWRASSRLTLTYGLRWDLDFSPSADNGVNLLSVTGFNKPFNPSELAVAPAGRPLWKNTYGNLAPRVGIAYQLSQASGHETVLRGGFGIFYDLASQGVGGAITANSYPFGAMNVMLGPALGGISTFPFTPDEAQLPTITAHPEIVWVKEVKNRINFRLLNKGKETKCKTPSCISRFWD